MRLLIVGAGGYGRLVKEIAELTEQFDKLDCCAVWSKPVIANPNEAGDSFF